MPISLQDVFGGSRPEGSIQVSLEEARSATQSLLLLVKDSVHPGLGDWINSTREMMSRNEMETNELVICGLHYAVLPQESWHSFPAYIDHLAAMDPTALRDKMLAVYDQMPCCGLAAAHLSAELDEPDEPAVISLKEALQSADQYLAYLGQRFAKKNIKEEIERKAYRLVIDPPEMQRVVVEHLRLMWKKYLAAEWQRVRPILNQAVFALRQLNLSGTSFSEAVRLATGQEINDEKFEKHLLEAKCLVFVPHPHTGPYIMRQCLGQDALYVFISARLPEGSTLIAPDLTRSEIVVRLNALTDDTRLQILRLIVENGELRSQEIIDMLELSQSAASRHLMQLTAAGYLKERRRDGAKCYSLNADRVNLTLQAVANYLLIGERSLP